MGTKKGMRRKTARRAYEPRRSNQEFKNILGVRTLIIGNRNKRGKSSAFMPNEISSMRFKRIR